MNEDRQQLRFEVMQKYQCDVNPTTEVGQYYKSDFAYRSDFFFKSEGKIYSYQVMRAALDFFGEREPKIFKKVKATVLGFNSIDQRGNKNPNIGTLKRYYSIFRNVILRYLRSQEWVLMDEECPNPKVFNERKSRIERLKNRNLNQLDLPLFRINGEKVIMASALGRMMRNSAGNCLTILDQYTDRNQVLHECSKRTFKGKSVDRIVYYFNRKQCQMIVDHHRFSEVRDLLTADLEKVFSGEAIVKGLN